MDAMFRNAMETGRYVSLHGEWNHTCCYHGVVTGFDKRWVYLRDRKGRTKMVERDPIQALSMEGPSEMDLKFQEIMLRSGYTVLTPEDRVRIQKEQKELKKLRTADRKRRKEAAAAEARLHHPARPPARKRKA